MVNKLDFLLYEANLGTYNKCETIEILGFTNNKAFNIFTLIIFEQTKEDILENFLTNGLQKIKDKKNIKWAIKRRIIDISEAKQIYNDLLKNELNLDSKINIDIGQLNLLEEMYIPRREDMHHEIQLNYILKNNFHTGSYILDFFDEEKNNVKFLLNEPHILNTLSETISEILPLKIANVSDRLGNIIFQFPINNFEISHSSKRKEKQISYEMSVEIYPKNKNFDFSKFQLRLYEDNDNSITRQKLIKIKNNITNISLDDCFGTHIEIIDQKTSLLLYKYKFSIMKQMHVNMGLVSPQKRVFSVDDKIQKIQVNSNEMNNSIFGQRIDKPFDEWIRDRKYQQELKELEKNKAFVQYFGNEKAKALNDIRELINKHEEKGVYLWDPYLSAMDIKNTLYFCKSTYVPLKAITGFANYDKKHKREEFKRAMIEEFNKDDKQFLLLNLEVRGKLGTNGYNFHDRFLIFPLDKPKVWSLGISVNQLGQSHHILQEVKNAQHILDAFDKLWNELNHEECLVWKSN